MGIDPSRQPTDTDAFAGLHCGILGAGRLGTALALALDQAGALEWVCNRGATGRATLREALGPHIPIVARLEDIPTIPNVVILAVSDAAIAELAQSLAATYERSLADIYIIHCSGALTLDVLQPCRDFGAKTLALHPFQTFAAPATDAFRGIAWGVEAVADCRAFAEKWTTGLGGRPVYLPLNDRQTKARYHAAAVVASNYCTALVDIAADLARSSGMQPAELLPPIMQTALNNALDTLEADASELPMTGPIVRGDIDTLGGHIESLKSAPALLRHYCLLGLAALAVAEDRGFISREQAEAMKRLLQSEIH